MGVHTGVVGVCELVSERIINQPFHAQTMQDVQIEITNHLAFQSMDIQLKT